MEDVRKPQTYSLSIYIQISHTHSHTYNIQEPPRDIFQTAQKEVYDFILSDLYPTFLSSSYAIPFWEEVELDAEATASKVSGM